MTVLNIFDYLNETLNPLDPTKGPTLIDKFSAIRIFLLDRIGYINIVFALGCFFCAFQLIKITYNMSSDERGGGFGGITLREIVQPFLILMLLQFSPAIIKLTDRICCNITCTIEQGVKLTHVATKKTNYPLITMIEQYREGLTLEEQIEFDQAIDRIYNNPDYLDLKTSNPATYNQLVDMDIRNYIEFHQSSTLNVYPSSSIGKEFKNAFQYVVDFFRAPFSGVATVLTAMLSSLAALLLLIYKWMYYVVLQIYLTILSLLFPLVVCFSILDLWKDNLKNFFPKYVQIWSWQLIITIVFSLNELLITLLTTSYTLGSGKYLSGLTNSFITLAVALASIQVIKKTPELAGTILHAMSSGSAVSGGGHEAEVVVNTAVQAVKTTERTVAKVAANTVAPGSGMLIQ